MFDLTEEQKFEVLTPIPAHVILEFPILELCRLHGQGIEGFYHRQLKRSILTI